MVAIASNLVAKAKRFWKTVKNGKPYGTVVFLLHQELCGIEDTPDNRKKLDMMIRDLAACCVGSYTADIREQDFVDDVLVTAQQLKEANLE